MRLADEIALQGAEEFLNIAHEHVSRSKTYMQDLRAAAFDLFGELWPAGQHVDAFSYLVTIDRDMDKIPGQLIDDLAAALARQATAQRASNPAASSAAQLVSNWLKMRAIEMRADTAAYDKARALRHEHTSFFSLVLGVDGVNHSALAS